MSVNFLSNASPRFASGTCLEDDLPYSCVFPTCCVFARSAVRGRLSAVCWWLCGVVACCSATMSLFYEERATHGLAPFGPQCTVGVLAGTHMGGELIEGELSHHSANPCVCGWCCAAEVRLYCSASRELSENTEKTVGKLAIHSSPP